MTHDIGRPGRNPGRPAPRIVSPRPERNLMTTDRLRDAARRALDSLNDLIADSSDPGTEALGARFELETALTNTPVPPPTNRAAVLREAANIAESLRQFERCTGPRRAAQTSENVGILRVADALRRMAAEEQPAETQADRGAVLLEIATTLDGLAETDMIRKRRSLGTARRLLAGELRKMAAEPSTTEPAVGEQPETQRPVLPCNWARTRHEHTPHDWEPQPGMDPVHCPGHGETP